MRKTVVLKSAVNDKLLCADRNVLSPIGNPAYHGVSILANRDNHGPWEEHEVEFNSDRTLSFRSKINDDITALWSGDPEQLGSNKYRVVANRPDKPSDEAGAAERWRPVFVKEATRFGSERIENAWALQNVFNDKFMSVDPSDPEGKVFAIGEAPNENELFYSSIPLVNSMGGGHTDPGPVGDLTPLVVNGRLFANSSGPFDYREVSAFALLERFRQGQIQNCRELLRVFRIYGANAVRVIGTLGGPYWENVIGLTSGPNREGFYESLVPFVRFCAENGFYVRFTLIGGLEYFGGFSKNREDVYRSDVHEKAVQYIHNVMAQIGHEPNVLFEVANEWNQIGMRDSDDRIVELGRLVKRLSPRLMNLTNTNGPIADDPMWAREPADFVDAHLERWTQVGGFSWVKRSSESPVVDQDDMPFISGEAINFGTPQPGRPDDAESSPAVAFAYGALSHTKRYLTNFHYHGGLSASVPDAPTQACMEGWKRGLDAIPFTFPGSWCNGHHSCSPWDINIFPREGENEERHTRGPIRIFGLNGSEGYIGVSIAERANAGIPAHRRQVQEVDRITYGGYSSAVYRA